MFGLTRLNPFFLQDVPDGLSADPLDAELTKLAKDAGVSKRGRLR